jgi:hypothetical protein
MKHNILQFVSDILANDKLTPVDKQKIIELAKRDVQAFSLNAETLNDKVVKVEEKIEMIEEKIGLKNEIKPLIEDQNSPNPNKLPQYINPFSNNGISKFLKAYNENVILKSTCHEIDDKDSLEKLLMHCNVCEYEFNTHLKCIKSEFNKLSNEYIINKKIYSLIKGYIYGGVKWSSDNIEMSWSDINLLKWSNLNPNSIPNPGLNFVEKNEKEGYHLTTPFTSSLTGKNVTTFSDFVLLFKSMFHINSNNSLKKHIARIIQIKKIDEWADIDFNENKFGDNIHLYTDVDKLIQAFVKITELIKSIITEHKVKDKPIIRLSFYEHKNSILFTIHYVNTKHKKSLGSTLSHPYGLSLPPIIEDQINGLCNLELKADFDNNDYALINIWNGKPIEIIERVENFEGVEFILKFER